MMQVLPGFGAAVRNGDDIFFRAAATGGSGSTTITIPSNAKEGDLAVLVENGRIGPPPINIPTGWTPLWTDTVVSNTRVQVSWKRLDFNDPGSTITGMGGNNGSGKVMLVFAVENYAATIIDSLLAANGTDGDPSPITIASAAMELPQIQIGQAGGQSPAFVSPTPTWEAEYSGGRCRVGYRILMSAEPNLTVDVADTGVANICQAICLVVR